jgi:hypothetical protein
LGKKLDQFRQARGGGGAVQRVQQAQAMNVLGMLQREIDRGRACGIVGNRDDFAQLQALDHRLQIA